MAASPLQEVLEPLFHSRKLLYFPTWHQYRREPATAIPPSSHDQFSISTMPKNTLDASVIIMVISGLVCALICSICWKSIVRWYLRYSSLVLSEDSSRNNPTGARLSNTGVKKQALKTFPVVNYSEDLKYPGLDSECAICLSEFDSGELIRVLPKCKHGFHVKCIDRWLNSHTSCPTCRHCLTETCQKITGREAMAGSQAPPEAPRGTNVRIAPLEREGFASIPLS